MGKIKGIRIGSGFVLTEEKGRFKVRSVSGNFSMRVDSTLPFYVACREAVSNINFRPILENMIVMSYIPVSVAFNPSRYRKYAELLNGFVKHMRDEDTPATDAEHDGSLQRVREEYEMREKLKKEMESPD